MPYFVCKTCGVEYSESEAPPSKCIICEDDRQYVGWNGQQWITMDELKKDGYKNDVRQEETGLLGIGISPSFTIGQRALLVQTDEGNILYDCVSLLDNVAINAIKEVGGIQGICLSHPHFYDTMVTWSHAFDRAPIYVPEADKDFVTRPDPVIRYWNGEPLELLPGVTLIQCGGHFPGSAVLHWADAAEGRGALMVGDTKTVVMDRRYVSFMNSYPNLIPLSASEVRGIVDAVEPYEYERIYGGWWGRAVKDGAKEAVRNSAERYIRRIGG